MDWVVLGIVVLPFVTGILAYHQILNYELMLILHIVAGELMLVAIPFTRLSHMLFGFFSRAYMGSEFGAVRHAKDW
jgi:nitrate reductase gamma subunit